MRCGSREVLSVIAPPGGSSIPVVGHVPHAGVGIPAGVRQGLSLDDAALAREIARMTDWRIDALFAGLVELGGVLLVNPLSRLVVDPERFPDDEDEPMAASGMGAVYDRTADEGVLRKLDGRIRESLMERYYRPYHEAVTAEVDTVLGRFGRCLIIDAHSFASEPLPFEQDRTALRPEICVGTDPFHTPERVAAAIEAECAKQGLTVARDRPFSGSFVPAKYYSRSPEVNSIMIEVRKDVYLDPETGPPLARFPVVREVVERIVGAAVESWGFA